MSTTPPADTIVLIHGLWMTPLSWEHWVAHFEARGNRAPLLIIGGGSDHIVPPRTSRTNFKLYHKSKAITEYKEFPGCSHFTVGQDGWEEVADYALDWANSHTRALATAGA